MLTAICEGLIESSESYAGVTRATRTSDGAVICDSPEREGIDGKRRYVRPSALLLWIITYEHTEITKNT